MGKQHKRTRQYRLIGFKAYFDTDAVLIDWWEGMDEGSRSEAIRELIHEALGLRPPKPKSVSNLLPDLNEIRQNTRWIVQAVDDIPTYLEGFFSQAKILQPAGNAPPVNVAPPNMEALDEAESQRREHKLKRVGW